MTNTISGVVTSLTTQFGDAADLVIGVVVAMIGIGLVLGLVKWMRKR